MISFFRCIVQSFFRSHTLTLSLLDPLCGFIPVRLFLPLGAWLHAHVSNPDLALALCVSPASPSLPQCLGFPFEPAVHPLDCFSSIPFLCSLMYAIAPGLAFRSPARWRRKARIAHAPHVFVRSTRVWSVGMEVRRLRRFSMTNLVVKGGASGAARCGRSGAKSTRAGRCAARGRRPKPRRECSRVRAPAHAYVCVCTRRGRQASCDCAPRARVAAARARASGHSRQRSRARGGRRAMAVAGRPREPRPCSTPRRGLGRCETPPGAPGRRHPPPGRRRRRASPLGQPSREKKALGRMGWRCSRVHRLAFPEAARHPCRLDSPSPSSGASIMAPSLQPPGAPVPQARRGLVMRPHRCRQRCAIEGIRTPLLQMGERPTP